MPNIEILSPHVADLIAAGEVVERPGSVVKELLENSFDAGAKNVTVEIRGGGMTYIRMTDDGCGMSPEDAGIAFLRHATSKLHDERGLEAIGTLGFRGEALAAISAVSRIELLTRERGASSGTRIVLEAGDIMEMDDAGCPEGTTIIVRDLFYNTPARLKFLKSERAEASNCTSLALRCALGRPEISVRCIKDGREEFFSPGDGRADSCIYSLLGRDIASSFLACCSDDGSVKVHGYVSSPIAAFGNRSHQYFFCNGRNIKSNSLQAALEQAYKNCLLSGRFPACVLYVELSYGAVDVNVHPTKTEVKFSDERRVFGGAYYAALGALSGETDTADIKLSSATKKLSEPVHRQSEFAPRGGHLPKEHSYEPPIKAPWGLSSPKFDHQVSTLREPTSHYQTQIAASEMTTKPDTRFTTATSPSENRVINNDVRIIGEALCTYIIAESGDSLILIDKHAAHERIIFDRLKADPAEIMSQTLLIPVTLNPDAEAYELLIQNSSMLSDLGFQLEAFGESALILRAIPAEIDRGDAGAALEEIYEKLRSPSKENDTGTIDEVLHTVACKAAIKAGRRSEPEELLAIARMVVSGKVKYCPHGRPVALTLSKKDLDKQFKRI